MDVDIFIPGTIDQFAPDTGFNIVKLLEKLDISVHYNPDVKCCGREAFYAGYWDVARLLGEKFINGYTAERPILVPSANCLEMIKKQFSVLFKNSSLHNKAFDILKNTYEVLSYINRELNISDFRATFPYKVLLVNPGSDYADIDSINNLLGNVKSMHIEEMQADFKFYADELTFNLVHEPIASSMIKEVIDLALKNGVDYIVLHETSAIMLFNAYINKNSVNIKTIHPIDILGSNW